MYTQGAKIEDNIDMPPIPKEVLLKLPRYCPKATGNNTATLYYYLNREVVKKNRELQEENKELKQSNERLREKIAELEKEKEELKLEKDKLLGMLFKTNRRKQYSVSEIELKQRDRESYIRPVPSHIDEHKEAILKTCPYCNHKLAKSIAFYQRIIEDIPSFEEQKIKAIKYTINRYYCRHCRKIISAKPREVLPRTRIGLNTLLYVLYLKYRLRLTQPLIQENLKTYFHFNLSKGEVDNLLNTGREAFKDKWQQIIEEIKRSDKVFADETSWRINGQNSWLWVFTSDKASRYTISESRGKGVPQKALGKNYKGIVISDFYSAYNQFKHKQRCWVHLLRKARELTEQHLTNQRRQISHKLNRIYQKILFFRSQTLTKRQRSKKAKEVKQKLLSISRIKTNDKELQKLLNRCQKYAGELVVCVRDSNVLPDNNSAERALRPSVLMRKISGSSRSRKGALTYEINLSVIETLRKQKEPLFPAMKQLVLDYITSNG